jgi:hypothetical protein
MRRKNTTVTARSLAQYATAGGSTVDLLEVDSGVAELEAVCNGCGDRDYAAGKPTTSPEYASSLQVVERTMREWAQAHATRCSAIPPSGR